MREPIENEYFNWLCAKVLDSNSRNYHTLLTILHQTEFVVVVHADRHRTMDGSELRNDFLRETNQVSDSAWENQPVSVLEVLIAFAKRLLFQTDIPLRDWFWEFITNLHLEEFRYASNSDIRVIENILNTFIWRTYDPNGDGGLFPMSQTQNDQRKIEIWYQWCEYVNERGLF